MENIYDQLYYVFIESEVLPLRTEQGEIIEELTAALSLPPEKRLLLTDIITYIRDSWGHETFAAGLRLGLELAAPYESRGDYHTLREFLSKLDQPVT